MLHKLKRFMKDKPELEWFIFKSGLPWIELDLKPPYEEMLHEAMLLKNRFIEYRENNSKGWKSLCIHGIASEKIYDYTYYSEFKDKEQNTVPYKWTDISSLCPVTTNFLKNSFFSTKFFRVRFMLLEPGGFILPHTDMPNKILAPINIALNNPKGCIFKMRGYGVVPFKPGRAFILDTSNEHIVFNNSKETRIHLICHLNYPLLSKENKEKWAEFLLNSFQNKFK